MDRSLVLMNPTGHVRAHPGARLARFALRGLTTMIAGQDIGRTAIRECRRKPPVAGYAYGQHDVARPTKTVCMHEGVAAADASTLRPATGRLAIRATKTKDTRRSAHG